MRVTLTFDEKFLQKLQRLGLIVEYQMHQDEKQQTLYPKHNNDGRRLSATQLLQRLNEKAGLQFRLDTKAHIAMIMARLVDFKFEELAAMIDFKCGEWLHNEQMAQYLRPSTLFNATKCAEYVAQSNHANGAKEQKHAAVMDLFKQ